jgi:hypothetical protein
VLPPNKRLATVDVSGVVGGDVTVTSIRQDEPVAGHGNACADATGVGTAAARVRAERLGNGDGRVYHVGFVADDGHGGTCEGEVLVCVPAHGHRPCEDQGPQYDSTVPVCRGCTDLCGIETAASALACGDEPLPAAFVRQLTRTRALLASAARKGSAAAQTQRVRVAAKLLRRCEAMLAADVHDVSTKCGNELRTSVRAAIDAVDDWLASPR